MQAQKRLFHTIQLHGDGAPAVSFMLDRGKTGTHGRGHRKDIQTETVARGTCTVPELQHACHGTEKMHKVLSRTLMTWFELYCGL